ncbi:formate dehydrogenase accessory sulfurtransferase FdhD [Phaeovulum sp.]|uniref:formate dehydrogenase accessory sulfurtransferase FdhD n=1 Tax=Phaeovulum sp. TaxID=2934796 RepID=UPI0039E2F6E8
MRALWSSRSARRYARGFSDAGGALAEEVPVALVYDGTTQAVMMASPGDLEEFVTGFALTEGLVRTLDEITAIEIVDQPKGIEARAWLVPGSASRLAARQRGMVGPLGCGLCGIDSLEQALRALPPVPRGTALSPRAPAQAMAALATAQPLQDATRAAHAAGFWHPERGLVILREDVGRHNALDKLAGALAQAGIAPATGALVMTSRLSVDLVQKAAMIGAPVLIGASAPTALAVTEAEAAGLTLIARARGETYEIHSHPDRIDAKDIQ